MEVGAVKQAFNNEVIQLKKNLNQAKIQIIHKLTRKAKTLTEKKAPEHLKEKNKKKAESAVKEVLIIKKLKPRDIARFIILNKAELNTHLNKPIVDNDKACARLLLHKALQQKYKMIKDKFGDIPIKDLLMSRQERLKIKKEAREAQKDKMNKKKAKEAKVVNSEGDWNVEDVKMGDDSKEIGSQDGSGDEGSDDQNSDAEAISKDDSQSISDDDAPVTRLIIKKSKHDVSNEDSQDISDDDDDDDDTPVTRQVVNDSDESSDAEIAENNNQHSVCDSNDENVEEDSVIGSEDEYMEEEVSSNSECGEKEQTETVKSKPAKQAKQAKSQLTTLKTATTDLDIEEVLLTLKPKKKPDKKVKDNKNRNLNKKMLGRKFKKDTSDSHMELKVVDPFFKTATGESYMTVAEQRPPDEFKEIHRQGNRQERRAAMFGRDPIRPRNNKPNLRFGNSNNRNDSNAKFNKFEGGNDRRGKFNDRNNYNKGNNGNYKFTEQDSKYNDRNKNFNGRNDSNSNFNDKSAKFNDGKSNFNDRNCKYNDRSFNNNKSEPKEEKLHPSWEAKKKQSGILPYKGKKIVFDES